MGVALIPKNCWNPELVPEGWQENRPSPSPTPSSQGRTGGNCRPPLAGPSQGANSQKWSTLGWLPFCVAFEARASETQNREPRRDLRDVPNVNPMAIPFWSEQWDLCGPGPTLHDPHSSTKHHKASQAPGTCPFLLLWFWLSPFPGLPPRG